MWLTKKVVMEDFAAEVKQGNYKKIDYQTWRELKLLPEEWDLNVQMRTYSTSETNPIFSTIGWDGCNWPYEFPANDGSLGEYITKILTEYYNTPTSSLNSLTFSNAINKVSEATVNAGAAIRTVAQASNWITSSSSDWTSISSNFYEKQPAVEITEEGINIQGKNIKDTIIEKVNEAAGFSINGKENDSMNLFKNFDFGSCENDNVKMSMYGIAVKNANGTWVSYDAKSENVVDVDILNFDAKYLYKMPVAIKDVKVGDVVIHNRKPMFVTVVEGGKLGAIDPAAGEEKVILLTKSMFGFDFVTKVVNFLGNISAGASEDAPFGNILPLMMLADGGKSDDILPLMFLTNGGNFDMSNPMMLYFLMNNNNAKLNDMLPVYLFMNGSYLGAPNAKICNCGCDKTDA